MAKIDYDSLAGTEYGRLKILGFIGRDEDGRPFVKCLCSCGKIIDICLYKLRNGNTKSCGCYRSDYVTNKNKTHGLRYSPIYKTWTTIKGRCYNTKNKDFKYYGNVGIKMSEEWYSSFENFYNDMYQSYLEHCEKFGKKNTSLDRINPHGDYCKDNCRWATWKEQNESGHKRKFK